MDQRRTGGVFFVFLAALAFAALLGGCGGSSKETMDPATGAVLSASTPTVGVRVCMTCHTEQTSAWLDSKHANLESSPSFTTTAACTSCHDNIGDSAQFTPQRMVVGCESCHGPGSLHAGAGGTGPISVFTNTTGTVLGSGPTVTVSGQFVMCTSCHELLNTAGTGSTVAAHDTGGAAAAASGKSGVLFSITDTHFATVPVTYSTSTTITGYAMDFSRSTVCTDCHEPHRKADINRDWAESGHGDMTAGPWSRNWSDSANQFCQRCHTTTGFRNYANANAAHDTATVSNIWNGLVSNFTSTSWKPEMLECTGCHTDNRGNLRNPGAYTATYGFRTGSPAKIYAYSSHRYPNISSSNVCILCHSGRNSGETIHLLNTAQAGTTAIVSFASFSVSTAHDMTAAGSMFRSLGYEYSGRTYVDPASYRHIQVGTSAVPNTGRGGPCVGCHMYRTGQSASHLFSAVSKSGDTVTNVSSEVCFLCHAGSSTGLAAIVENERASLDEALRALDAQLRVVSLVTGSAYPRGTNASNWLSPGDTDTTGETTGKNNMGAAFNRSFLMNEPGAYVHNSKYTKRLIYDSIDWVDDNELNYSVGNTLSTSPTHSGKTWQAGAMSYLLPNGVRPFAESERPY